MASYLFRSAEQDFVKLEGEDRVKGDGEARRRDSAGSAAAKAKALKQRADKKAATLERKKRKQPSYDLLKEAKVIWEELRQKELEKSKRQAAYERLMALIGGKVAELVLKHDASRIVQTAVKYAAPEGRARILSELKGHMVELSKSHYGRFLVQKLLLHGTKEQRSKIMQEFYGKVVSLIKHKVPLCAACLLNRPQESVAVIDYAYANIASTAQKRFLVQVPRWSGLAPYVHCAGVLWTGVRRLQGRDGRGFGYSAGSPPGAPGVCRPPEILGQRPITERLQRLLGSMCKC